MDPNPVIKREGEITHVTNTHLPKYVALLDQFHDALVLPHVTVQHMARELVHLLYVDKQPLLLIRRPPARLCVRVCGWVQTGVWVGGGMCVRMRVRVPGHIGVCGRARVWACACVGVRVCGCVCVCVCVCACMRRA